MKKIRLVLSVVLCVAIVSACSEKEEEGGGGAGGEYTFTPVVGKVMPAWQEGCFDIHFISSPAGGECTYLIYPDGTQMLIDAGGGINATNLDNQNTGIRARWEPVGIKGFTKDSQVTFDFGNWVSKYIRNCQTWTGSDRIDYVMNTHLHPDHFGTYNNNTAIWTGTSDQIKLTSLIYVLKNFKIGKISDRAYPSYDYPYKVEDPVNGANNAAGIANWHKAINYMVSTKGTKAEMFEVGSTTQFAPAINPGKCPGFTALNLCVNGKIWTGEKVLETFPPKDKIVCANHKKVQNTDYCPEENHCSAAMKFTYGNFDFYAPGDLQYDGCSNYAWKDISTNVAKYCGVVDVMKAEHHGSSTTNGTGTTTGACITYLKPQCWIVCGFTDIHPRKTTFENVVNYLGNKVDVYINHSCDEMRTYNKYSGRVKGDNGHVVVRVYDNGNKYYVFTVEEFDPNDSKQTTPTYKVKTVNSYNSK